MLFVVDSVELDDAVHNVFDVVEDLRSDGAFFQNEKGCDTAKGKGGSGYLINEALHFGE